MNADLLRAFADFGEHDGYAGVYTRHESEGCLKNGTRIYKSMSDDGDATPTGTAGTVLGSLSDPRVGKGYFVEWDDKPKTAVFVIEQKIAAYA